MTPLSLINLLPIHLPKSTPYLVKKLYTYSNGIQYSELLQSEYLKQSRSQKQKPLKLPEKKTSQFGHILP